MKHRILEHIAALFVPAVCFLIFALPAGAQTPEYPGLINRKILTKLDDVLPTYAQGEYTDLQWGVQNADSMWYSVALTREYLENEYYNFLTTCKEGEEPSEEENLTEEEYRAKAAEDAAETIDACVERGKGYYIASVPEGTVLAVQIGDALIYLDRAQYEALDRLTDKDREHGHIVVKDNGDLWLDDELGGTLWMAKTTVRATPEAAPADSPDSTGAALLVVGGTVAVGAAATAVYFLTHAEAYQRVVTAVQTAWSGLTGGAQGSAALAEVTPAA
jgi:hypothetical protein